MGKDLKRILLGILVSLVLMLQVAFCNSQNAYANTKNTNNIEQKQNNHDTNKEVSKHKKEFSKQKVGIGIGILLVVLIVGRAITPKEAFEPLKKNNKK